MVESTERWWPGGGRAWLGALLGAAVGVFDTISLGQFGVHMTLDGMPALWPALFLFGGSYTVLGWLVGRLWEMRRQARRDAATIAAQMHALERNRRALVEAEKLAWLGRMAAGVAHEVRNPLGVMRSSASLIEEGLGEEHAELRRVGSFIRQEVDRLDGFVGAVLGLSRPIAVRPALASPQELVQRAVTLAGEHLGERPVALETSQPDGVVVDGDLLVQVLLGLLINASQATGEQGRVQVRTGAGDDTFWWLEVADDGEGLPEQGAERLFEAFFTTRAQGTGLGLAMAARMVQAQGGSITARPGGLHGRGATLRIELPLTVPDAQGERA